MTSLDDSRLDQYADVDDYSSQRQQMRDLAKAMDALSPPDAALLRMKYQQGLSIEQIARELALNQSAVKMRLKRSRQRVRQLYAKIAWVS